MNLQIEDHAEVGFLSQIKWNAERSARMRRYPNRAASSFIVSGIAML